MYLHRKIRLDAMQRMNRNIIWVSSSCWQMIKWMKIMIVLIILGCCCGVVDSELTKSDQEWLKRKLKVAEIGENFDVSKMKKIVAGKKLWNYDNLEPTEKKGAI